MLPSVKFLLVLLGIHNGVDKDGDTSMAPAPEMLHHNPITHTTSDSRNDLRGLRKIQERSCSMNNTVWWKEIVLKLFYYQGADKRTRYKMGAKQGENGHKFSCPPDENIYSCR